MGGIHPEQKSGKWQLDGQPLEKRVDIQGKMLRRKERSREGKRWMGDSVCSVVLMVRGAKQEGGKKKSTRRPGPQNLCIPTIQEGSVRGT